MLSAFLLPGTRLFVMAWISPFIIQAAAAPFGCPVKYFWQMTSSGLPFVLPKNSICSCVTALSFLSLALVPVPARN